MRPSRFLALVFAGPPVLFGACFSKDTSGPDATVDAPYNEVDGAFGTAFCELPGSLVFGTNGTTLVAGGESAPALTWLTLPPGFCAHYFANVPTPRQSRFAPGGELFVASPSTATAGGAPPGLGAVIVLADDNFDGYAAVLVQLRTVTKKPLREAIEDAWLACAPEPLARTFLGDA